MKESLAKQDYQEEDGAPMADLPAPVPAPGMAAYRSERRKCLLGSPRTLLNFMKYRLSNRRAVRLSFLPIAIDFENVSRCNFRCTMCQVSDWNKGQRAADMTLQDFRQVLDQQYGVIELKIQGYGEPTMGAPDLFEMIAYARRRHIWVRSTTNGSLLHLKESHRKIIDSDINELQVSIDGADKETFESIRNGAVFDRVRSNCELLNEYCHTQGVRRTKMAVLLQKKNRRQLPELVRLAGELGFPTMTIQLNMHGFGIPDWEDKNDAEISDGDFDATEGWSLVNLGNKVGVDVYFWRVSSKYRTDSPEHLCPWPFERSYVASDLRVVPCCKIGNPDILEVGDARKLSALWNDEEMQEFRLAHLKGQIPKECVFCYDSAGKVL